MSGCVRTAAGKSYSEEGPLLLLEEVGEPGCGRGLHFSLHPASLGILEGREESFWPSSESSSAALGWPRIL